MTLDDIPISEATSKDVYHAAREDGYSIWHSMLYGFLTPAAKWAYDITQ